MYMPENPAPITTASKSGVVPATFSSDLQWMLHETDPGSIGKVSA
jgi:hypothetical protein